MVNYYHLKDPFTLANEKLSGDERLCLLNTLLCFLSLMIVIMSSALLRNVLLLLIFSFNVTGEC